MTPENKIKMFRVVFKYQHLLPQSEQAWAKVFLNNVSKYIWEYKGHNVPPLSTKQMGIINKWYTAIQDNKVQKVIKYNQLGNLPTTHKHDKRYKLGVDTGVMSNQIIR